MSSHRWNLPSLDLTLNLPSLKYTLAFDSLPSDDILTESLVCPETGTDRLRRAAADAASAAVNFLYIPVSVYGRKTTAAIFHFYVISLSCMFHLIGKNSYQSR